MNKTVSEAKQFLADLKKLYPKYKSQINPQVKFGLAVPFTNLHLREEFVAIDPKRFTFGAQNFYQVKSGAFTGEISCPMIKELGADIVVVGHSERRAMFGDTNEIVNQKIKIALDNNITPILCVGETLEQYEAKQTKQVVENQLRESLKNVDVNKVVIAYEPIWAIGTGKTATSEIAQEVISEIRKIVKSEDVCIQYGGSVKPNNVKELMTQKDINGALVGGASLDAESFLQLGIF